MNTLPTTTSIQYAHLQVSNLARSLAFYRDLMGFKLVRQDERTAYLSANGQEPARLILTEIPDAIGKPRRSSGLYHIAILLPDRVSLARLFKHMLQHEYPFGGFSDHAVSEALYLSDPDGNGLELYRDRPREQWRFDNGQLRMGTDPLDLDDLLSETLKDPSPWTGLPEDTIIGHVHLHVSDLMAAEAFYRDVIGLDVMVGLYNWGASFLSAGGYHHHLGINVWAGQGVPPPPKNAVGIRSYALVVDGGYDALLERLQKANVSTEEVEYGLLAGVAVNDPAGNRVELLHNAAN